MARTVSKLLQEKESKYERDPCPITIAKEGLVPRASSSTQLVDGFSSLPVK